MSQHRALLLASVVVLAATHAEAQSPQTTHVGTVSPGADRHYSFTPSSSGQFTATLSWDAQSSNLFLVLVCGTADPLTFGVAGGQLDRFARLEAGLLGTNPCVIGVSTFDAAAAYRLNLHHGANQTARAQFVHPIAPAGTHGVDALLVAHAQRALEQLKSQIR